MNIIKLREKLKEIFCWRTRSSCQGCEHANSIAFDGCQNPLFDELEALLTEESK